jgi:hypothetical protein
MDSSNLKEGPLKVRSQDLKKVENSLLQQAFQLSIFSFSLEKNFQNRFKELEEYVNHLLFSNDSFTSSRFSEENASILNDAKELFKKSSLEILDRIKHKFEEEKRIDLIPDIYLRQMVESTKQQLFLSYSCLIQEIICALPTYKKLELVENNEEILPGTQTKPKLNPQKTKFPKRSRQILQDWFQNHSDDPFPSYAEKNRLAEESGVTLKQVKCWFINVRRKRWHKIGKEAGFKAQIEKRLVENKEETKNLDVQI